jgi:hypothetical protein
VIVLSSEDQKKLFTYLKEYDGQIVSVLSIAITAYLAWYAYHKPSSFETAVFVGALGGITHELFQSQGKFMMPQYDKAKGEYYLGGLFGLIEGGVAGLILAQGKPGSLSLFQLLSEAFLAGLALKGVAEAVTPPGPNNPSQNNANQDK